MTHARLIPAVLAFFAAACAAANPEPRPPTVDGVFHDWEGVAVAATDPAGDATGVFDVTTLRVQTRGTAVFLRFDTGAERNLQSGVASDGTLRIEVGLPATATRRRLTIDFRARRATADGTPVRWVDIRHVTAPTHSAREFEARVDLATFGVRQGDRVTVDFSGSDALAQPVEVALDRPALAIERRSFERLPNTTFRVAALNTLQTGTLNATRRDQIGRLLKAVKADVYCLQEEYNSSSAGIASFLQSLNIHGDGAGWNVHKVSSNAVASRWPITPVAALNNRYSPALVTPPGGSPVLVMSAHLSCCGFAGSPEDQSRITQASQIAQTVAAVRAGPFGNVGAIMIGDWNLVGSRTPLDIMLAPRPGGPGLSRAGLAHLIGAEVATWRDDDSAFAPGMLDLCAYSRDRLTARNRFVLDTAALSPDELAALGLQAGDSLGSDHLLLVVDFLAEPTAPGDVDADGSVSAVDLFRILGDFGRAQPWLEPDLDADGSVGFSDLAQTLSAFGVPG